MIIVGDREGSSLLYGWVCKSYYSECLVLGLVFRNYGIFGMFFLKMMNIY